MQTYWLILFGFEVFDEFKINIIIRIQTIIKIIYLHIWK